MNAFESLLEAQTTALLRRLAREQHARSHRIRDDAAAQAADIVRKARTEARARVHEAVLDTRRELEQALTRRRAALETATRQQRQSALHGWLDGAWQALPNALAARWADPAARAQWCAAALQAAARDLLQQDGLQVEVDERWQADIAAALAAHTAALRGAEVVPRAGLGAGLRIRAGRACVDATVEGLLAPRARIAADLLAEFGARTRPEVPS